MGHQPHAKKARKRRSTETGVDRPKNLSPSLVASASSRREVVWEILFLILFCVVMALLALAFNHSRVGREFSFFVYRVLDGGFADPNDPKHVTLVDIGNLHPDSKSQVTPRKDLKTLLTAIAAYEPAAIGIDIDFAPETIGSNLKFVDKGDPDFFAFCENLSKSTPVYLGIFRTQRLPQSLWLGLPTYSRLAAGLLVEPVPVESIWSVSNSKENSDDKTTADVSSPTMSTALASKVGLAEPKLLQNLFKRVHKMEVTKDVSFDVFHINYGVRQRLIDTAIVVDQKDFRSLDELKIRLRPKGNDLKGNIVLIGDVNNAKQGDLFPDPASNRMPLPGVVVQACAVNSLIDSPLYVLPDFNDFLFDLFVSLAILAIVIVIRFVSSDGLNHERLMVFANFSGAALILLFGWILNTNGVRWADFLLLSIGLLLHPAAHRIAEFLKTQSLNWLKNASEVKS
jgi:CHASE2 domain-containing sensor protein